MNRGKEKCEFLRDIRRKVAERYGLTSNERECHHEGNCSGVCPLCDAELADLQRQLREKGVDDIDLFEELKAGMRSDNIDMDPSIDDPEELSGKLILRGEPEPFEGEMLKPSSNVHLIQAPSRKLLKKCYVAGLQFHDAVDFVLELSEGDRLFLIREPFNEHDSNAVAVAFADDYDDDTVEPEELSVLGYIPRSENSEIATMLDMGWANILECKVSEVNASGSWANRLEVAIYVKSNASSEPDSDEMSIIIVDNEEFDQMQLSLFDKGFIYFRWGGYPPWWRHLPKKGEQVLALNKHQQSFNAVLMTVLARGDDATVFVGRDEVDAVDDCSPFILSLVAGPTKLTGEIAKELRKMEIYSNVPEQFLKGDIVGKIKVVFAKMWR